MTTMKKMKRLLTAVIAAALVIATIPTALAAGGIFSDVPNGAWYADAVDYVYEHGIIFEHCSDKRCFSCAWHSANNGVAFSDFRKSTAIDSAILFGIMAE